MIKDTNKLKALTLLVLSKLGKIELDELISALLATGYTDIADVTDVFVFLTEDGLIELTKEGKECFISETGKEILPELVSLLGSGVAQEALEKALRFNKGAEYTAEIVQCDEGFLLKCRYFEWSKTVCEISMLFSEENEAIRAKINFLKRPDAIMGAVKASVTGNVGYMM